MKPEDLVIGRTYRWSNRFLNMVKDDREGYAQRRFNFIGTEEDIGDGTVFIFDELLIEYKPVEHYFHSILLSEIDDIEENYET